MYFHKGSSADISYLDNYGSFYLEDDSYLTALSAANNEQGRFYIKNGGVLQGKDPGSSFYNRHEGKVTVEAGGKVLDVFIDNFATYQNDGLADVFGVYNDEKGLFITSFDNLHIKYDSIDNDGKFQYTNGGELNYNITGTGEVEFNGNVINNGKIIQKKLL